MSKSRYVAEGLLIVVSILLAFGIQAWWESQRDSALESEHLLGLQQQFEASVEMIQDEIAVIRAAEGATLRLASLDVETAVATNPDSLAALFLQSALPGRANFPSGALEALLASGDVTLLFDRELAARLAAWPSLVAEAYENTGWLMEHTLGQFLPFLHEYVGGFWFADASGLEHLPPTRFPPRTRELFSDVRLEGHLYDRAARIDMILDRYADLAAEAETISTLIRDAI